MKKRTVLLLMILFVIFLTACSGTSEPPDGFMTMNKEVIEMEKATYEWMNEGLFSDSQTVVDSETPYQIAEKMQDAWSGDDETAVITFSSGKTPDLSAYTWNEDGRQEELSIENEQVTLPTSPGRHVIEVFAEWESGSGSYAIPVLIQ
ncbi:hypothetical protein EQV77_09460 [Halobacillus fulvus]|nr:hypothetical protein EQV77_09460 [Halobacillus fulvus]